MNKKVPHTYTIIFFIMLVMAILTWIVPSGEFKREDMKLSNGKTKTVVVQDSYHKVDKVVTDKDGKTTDIRQNLKQFLMAPIGGFEDAAAVVSFVLIIGGAFGIIARTGAIESGLSGAARGLQGKEFLLIPVIMILFGLGGTLFGMAEETIPFYMVFVPLMLSLGYDSLTGFMMIFLGAGCGTAASTLDPFSVGIAQGISQMTPGSGITFRMIQWVIYMAVAIVFVMLYARKVKKNPQSSPVYEIDQKNKEFFLQNMGDADKKEFNTRHKIVLIGFAVGMGIMIYGLLKKQWYIEEISMIFLGIGLFAGIAGGLNQKEMSESFVQGAKDLVYAAVVIGLSRAILIIARDGKIIDTILYGMSSALNGLPAAGLTTLMLLFQNLLAILVTSSSGLAALTMPVMAPLGDLVHVNRQVVVTAFQYGTGLTCMITPTAGTIMAALGIARIPWNKWAKFIWKFILLLWVLAAIFLIVGLKVYPV